MVLRERKSKFMSIYRLLFAILMLIFIEIAISDCVFKDSGGSGQILNLTALEYTTMTFCDEETKDTLPFYYSSSKSWMFNYTNGILCRENKQPYQFLVYWWCDSQYDYQVLHVGTIMIHNTLSMTDYINLLNVLYK